VSARWQTLLWLVLTGCSSSVAIFRADDLDAARPPEAGANGDAGPDGLPTRDSESDSQVDEEDAGALPAFVTIASFGHTCVAGEEGIFCWGRNRDGQLGVAAANREAPAAPVAVGLQRYAQVCAGEQHSCAMRTDGIVECWGNNERGQLGLGDTVARSEPTAIASRSFRSIACGGHISCGVAADQSVLCWGENAEGALGQGDDFGSPDLLAPASISAPGSFSQVSVGQGHACAVAEGGELYCWGRNTGGQLGLGGGAVQVRTPSPVDGDARYRRVAAGMTHSCAVRVDGSLFCWGSETDGQLGLGAPESDLTNLPRQVSGADYSDVQANWFHTCALHAGRLSCWGRNLEGQLGIGNTMGLGREEPSQLDGDGWSAIAVGQFHSCGLRQGAVYCWGKNDADRELGINMTGRRDVPTRVRFP